MRIERRGNRFRFSESLKAGRHIGFMIQSINKGIEIEMELHQQAHGYWKCDYTLIKHPRANHNDSPWERRVSRVWILPENTLCTMLVTR